MSFLFPRTATLSRPNADASAGAQPYGGVLASNETVIAASIRVRIQLDQQGTASPAKLPADAVRESLWKVIFKGPPGLARTGDVFTDDLGDRYQVVASYWGPLVTTCRCQILQA